MERLKRLYDFKGIATRKEFWLTWLALYAAVFVAMLVVFDLLGALIPGARLLFGVIAIAILVAGLALQVRRLHDRGKSGWWLLLFGLVPGLLGGLGEVTSASDELLGNAIAALGLPFTIWGLVEMGFLPGKRGANRYAALRTEEAAAAFD